MVDFSVNLAGVKFDFPTAVSAGPLTKDGCMVKKAALQHGVGAVVFKSVCKKFEDTPRPSMAAVKGSLLNYDWWAMDAEQAAKELKIAKEGNKPVIVSIYAGTKDLAEMARTVSEAKPDMLELPIGVPTLETLAEDIKVIKEAADLPLGVKVGPDLPDVQKYAKAIEKAGADYISGINTLGPGMAIDIYTGKPLLGSKQGHGSISGPAIKPLAVRCVAEMAKSVKIPVMGGGGVSDGKDAMEMFLVGASCIHVQTAAILRGLGVFDKIVKELEELMKELDYDSIDDFRGLALKHLREESSYATRPSVIDPSLCNGCGSCERVCVYDAIKVREGLARTDREACFGCGLCATVCPTRAIRLE